MSAARDFLEVERMPGWHEYKKRIEDIISHLKVDLTTMDTDNMSVEDIGLNHVRISEQIAGLETALRIPEDIKKEPADDL